jgi:hypothetical protein
VPTGLCIHVSEAELLSAAVAIRPTAAGSDNYSAPDTSNEQGVRPVHSVRVRQPTVARHVPEVDPVIRQKQRFRSASLGIGENTRGEQFTDTALRLLPELAVRIPARAILIPRPWSLWYPAGDVNGHGRGTVPVN